MYLIPSGVEIPGGLGFSEKKTIVGGGGVVKKQSSCHYVSKNKIKFSIIRNRL